VTFNNTFAAVPNAEGITPTTTQANDQFGLPWRSGSVTVTAIPIVYGNTNGTAQTIASLTLTLTGASSTPQVTLTAAPYTQTWSANPSATSGPRVQNVVITGPCCEVGNNVPLPTTPGVIAVDGAGNSIDLVEVGGGTNVSFRLDNEAPQAPLVFNIPGRQQGWVNAAYTFTGAGTGNGNANVNQTTGSSNFGTCGDGPSPVASPYLCSATRGVSGNGVGAAAITTNTSTSSNMTYSYYVIPAASYTSSNTASANNGTSTSPTACSTTGWTKVANGGEVASASSANNASFVVRVFETDKLGNSRCTDLSLPPATVGAFINTGANFFATNKGTFGVDVVPPTAVWDAASATDKQQIGIGGVIPSFILGLSDDASGFSLTPVSTQLLRLAPTGTNCAIGSLSGSTCNATDFSSTAPGNGSPAQGIGYYTYTGTARDLARNTAPALSRQIAVDNVAAPTMGSIAAPVTINGGSSVTFSSSAADDLDLISWDNSLAYPVTPNGGPAALSIRSAKVSIHAAFSGTLITSQSLSIVVPTFIRTASVTGAGGTIPAGAVTTALSPTSVSARAYDAGNNASVPNVGTGAGFSLIPAASINMTNPTDWSVSPNTAQPLAVMQSFLATNAVANISNCPDAGCAGNAAPANPITVSLTAAATGATGANFQFANPFSQVQFYYFDAVLGEYVLIGASSVPVVTDPSGTTRTFTFTFAGWNPPASLGVGAVTVVAVGVNSRGDALVSPVNVNITLTNP
jgi:hypothetical protein